MKNLSTLLFVILVPIVSFVFSCKKEADQPTPPQTGSAITANPTITGLAAATVTADASGSTYTITVPAGTDVKALKLTIPLAAGATINPDPTQAHDYTNPVSYTITKADGNKQTVTVKVVVQPAPVVPKSSEKQITGFTFAALTPALSASIDQSAHKITATVPTDVDLTKLVPTITVSAKATVSPASGAVQNFSNPVNYTITAEDGGTQIYAVNVDKESTTIPTGKGCLIGRIDNIDTKEYMTFQYDGQGRVIKMEGATEGVNKTLIPFTITCVYNASGDLLQAIKNQVQSYNLSYQNGKLIGYEYKEPNMSQKFDLSVNALNQLDQLSINGACVINFNYSNGSLIKYTACNTGTGQANVEYTTRKHFMAGQSNLPGWLTAFWFFFSLNDGEYTYNNITYLTRGFSVPYGQNSPSKADVRDGGNGLPYTINWTYKFNNEGFPTEMRMVYDYDSKVTSAKQQTFNYKLTYTNCQ